MTDPGGRGAVVREWIARHPVAFVLLETSKEPNAPVTIVEKATGKTLSISLGAVVAAETARDPVRGGTYVRVALDDGRSFALAGVGFVFEPSFVNTGPLADCPPAASFMDFEKLYAHLLHLADDEHEGHQREALQTMMVLIAFLDGARALGLQVEREERRLDAQLRKLEA